MHDDGKWYDGRVVEFLGGDLKVEQVGADPDDPETWPREWYLSERTDRWRLHSVHGSLTAALNRVKDIHYARIERDWTEVEA